MNQEKKAFRTIEELYAYAYPTERVPASEVKIYQAQIESMKRIEAMKPALLKTKFIQDYLKNYKAK